MKNNIYVTQPTLAPVEEYTPYLEKIWTSGVMTHNGPFVQEFERETSDFLGCSKPMVACTNGTLAIQLAIKALELKGEIITTPFTFIATISAIMWEHCTPVFVDIDPETLNIDPTKIEEKITCRTVAIMPVHVFGNACDIDAIAEIAERHHLKVIYDAAHGVGTRYKGKSVMEYGDISATSFHATKMLNTAEGGGCFTTSDDLLEKMRRIRFFGFENHSDIVEEGFNGKMTEVNAALGLANLKYLQSALDDRKEKYLLYKELLSKRTSLSFQKIRHEEECNYSYFPVIFENETLLLKVQENLSSHNIYPRRYFYPSVNTYRKLIPYTPMPISEDIASRILCLPLYYALSLSDVEQITSLLLEKV